MAVRRKARKYCIKILYMLEFTNLELENTFSKFWKMEGNKLDERTKNFTEEVIRGVWKNKEKIDSLIKKASLNWRIDRMAIVDRNILRLATYELMFLKDDIPYKVTLNEAIELGKKFGSEDSGAFINGILDKIIGILKIR